AVQAYGLGPRHPVHSMVVGGVGDNQMIDEKDERRRAARLRWHRRMRDAAFRANPRVRRRTAILARQFVRPAATAARRLWLGHRAKPRTLRENLAPTADPAPRGLSSTQRPGTPIHDDRD